MIALWLASVVAWADPVALRAPMLAPGATVGRLDLSVAAPLHQEWWLSVEARTNGATVGASVGRRWALVRGPRGWGFDGVLAAGVAVPTTAPGAALTATPALLGGWWGDDLTVSGGLALPLAVGWVEGPQARLPAIAELQLGGRAGPIWLGARLGAGAALTPGLDVRTVLEPAAWIAWGGAKPLIGRATRR